MQGQTPPPQTPLQQQQQLVQQQQIQQVLKQAADQASAAAAAKHNVLEQRMQMHIPARRESSDGSTTVSADGDQDHEDIDAMLLSDTIRRSEEAQLASEYSLKKKFYSQL